MWIRTKHSFPANTCKKNSPPPPALNCMKYPFESTIYVLDRTDGLANCLSDFQNKTIVQVHERVSVHFRGDSSLNFMKHQMAVNLANATESFVGLPQGSKWVLHAPWIDSSLMRNQVAHWMYRNTGRYSPRTRHVVVFMEDKVDHLDTHMNLSTLKKSYRGIYLLLEKISFERNRLGLAENSPKCTNDEINGGWAWQYNPLTFGVYSPNLVMDQYQNMFGLGERPVLEYPPGETLSKPMRDFFISPGTGPLPSLFRYLFDNMTDVEGLERHIDIGSYVDYILHTELSLNQDAYRRSAWFFKDRNQPINAGPVWDFNLAYGLGAKKDVKNWIMENSIAWKRLRCNYKLAGLLIQRWESLRLGPWSNLSIESFIDDSSFPIRQMLKHCKNWRSRDLGCAFVSQSNSETYDAQVRLLKMSVISRATWIDENIRGVYQKLNSGVCGSAGPLPNFNCAADPNDNGCIADPLKYSSALHFPPVHVPYSGPPCQSTSDSVPEAYVDPCWLSVGTYIEAGNITPFCSGYGICATGINATCICNNNDTTPDCSMPQHSNLTATHHHHLVFFPLLLGSIVVVATITRYWCVSLSNHESTLLQQDTTSYGTA